LGKSKQGIQTAKEPREDCNITTLEKWKIVKINGKEIQVDKFVYLGSVAEKKRKIKNKINEKLERLKNFII
jgi:hypothetical protein